MTLIINKKTDKFFLALCKSGWHTFVLVGQYEGFVVKQLFCRVAKSYQKNHNFFKDGYQLLKGGFQANLFDEGITREHTHEQYLSYQAYDITLEQYLELIASLSALQQQILTDAEVKKSDTQKKNKNQEIWAYIPKNENNELLTLEYLPVTQYNTYSMEIEDLKENTLNYKASNTCRTTAIHLLEKTLKAKFTAHVPQNWIRELNSFTYLLKGSPSTQVSFYVLPPPPDMRLGHKNEKLDIMIKLYKRMEDISHSQVGIGYPTLKQRTEDKFQAIKNLYQQLAANESISLQQMLKQISEWKSTNKSSLAAHRDPYLWDYWFHRECTTIKLVNKLEHRLQVLNTAEARNCI